MTQNDYCTYFDSRYLSRGLTLLESLRRHGELGRFWILCLDETAHKTLEGLALDNVHLLSLSQLEDEFPKLRTAKLGRSITEYYFTMTPWLCRYVRDAEPNAEWVTYLDADLFFFSSPNVIFGEMGPSDVAIVPHRFPVDQEWRLRFGTYNVGWVSFRSSEAGGRCLNWWADRCAEWCFDLVDDGRFADQGYLDSFKDAAAGGEVAIIENPGVNLAPWNLRGHTLVGHGDKAVTVDGHPLVFFHFHGLSRSGNRYYFKHAPYRVRTTALIKDRLYRPYLERLNANEALVPCTSPQDLARPNNKLALLRPGRRRIIRYWAFLRGDSLKTDLSGSSQMRV